MDDTIKNAAKVELAKLRKAQADYKAKLKQMQQKMATKLFNKEKTSASVEVAPETATTPVSPIPTVLEPKHEKAVTQSSSLDDKSSSNNEKEQTKAPESGKEAKSEATASISATTIKAEASAKGGGNNMMLLVATSLVVVLFSLVIAYIYR